jgi:hypothetical protein
MPRRAERIVKRGKDAEESHSIDEHMDDFSEMNVRVRRGKNHRKNQNDLHSRG